MYSPISNSLRGCDFRHGVFRRQVKSQNSARCQGVGEIQAIHPGEPGRLSKGEAFLAQVVNSGHQTNFLGKLLGLLAESEEEIVGDVYGNEA
jgi:hypothetical protein